MARVYQRVDRDGEWWIDYEDARGRRRRERVAPTKKAALAVLRSRLEAVALEKCGAAEPAAQDPTLGEFAEEFKAWAKAHLQPTTARRYASSAGILVRAFGKMRLSEIGKRDIETHMAARKGEMRKAGPDGEAKPLRPATVNRDVAVLKRMFSKAVEWGCARTNPVKGIRFLRENNCIVRYLTRREREELLRHCHGQTRQIAELALHTGMRKGEILNLTWACVDIENEQIHVPDSKNGEGRFIPMTAGAKACLETVERRVGIPWLFPGKGGRPLQDLKRSWGTALERAGIRNFRFHDLRHTFASYLAMAGATQREIQEFLGHKTQAMTARYTHLSPTHRREAIRRLDDFLARDGARHADDGRVEKRAVP